jgi:hypothetical protein
MKHVHRNDASFSRSGKDGPVRLILAIGLTVISVASKPSAGDNTAPATQPADTTGTPTTMPSIIQ